MRSVELAIVMTVCTSMLAAPETSADTPVGQPIYVFCGTGDHLWNPLVEPVDSPEAIDGMFDWMNRTYGVSRIYWRGAQSHMWDSEYQVGVERPNQHDWSNGWKRHLYRDEKINEAAVEAAHSRGMEIFAYAGLFEHGVQPDVGIICPYLFEDRLRIEHPEWCPVDRWGERRSPGPISFCYPEARKLIIDRYVDYITRMGYDGINFYTYVENVGIRYLDEFGFNEPIVAEFSKLHPDVDLRHDTLTEAQKLDWYQCRGIFVTQFVRELHAALSAKGKRLSMILDSVEPDYPQPWWGKDAPGQGMIRLDWEAWVAEGIVDELWVQLGATADQTALLDRLLTVCEGTDVKLTMRAINPYDEAWAPYVDTGATPVAVITWTRNGIERLSLEPTSAEALESDDWRLRAQTVTDVGAGTLDLPASAIAALADDPHLLVRRRLTQALGALGDPAQTAVIERALSDEQSCVRIAAAVALGTAGGPDSPARMLQALESDGHFQMKLACFEAMEAIGDSALPALMAAIDSPNEAVREVCVRALYKIGRLGPAEEVFEPLLASMLDTDEAPLIRYWAIDGLVGLRLKISDDQRAALEPQLRALVDGDGNVTAQLHAAWGLGYVAAMADDATRRVAIDSLVALLRSYGDGCQRSDAAFGWRIVGNALMRLAPEGPQALEQMRTQTEDRWLAWIAYEVVHVPQQTQKMQLIEEAEAVATHDRYAPEFPGIRSW